MALAPHREASTRVEGDAEGPLLALERAFAALYAGFSFHITQTSFSRLNAVV
jgi:hypothetical protein